MEKQTEKFYTPTNDIIFSHLFGQEKNKEFTKELLENILKKPIKEIELDKNTVIKKEHMELKGSILDIKCLLNNNTWCNIEMQIADQGNIEKRILYYWSKIYSSQLKERENYQELKKTIAVVIVDFEIEKTKEIKEYITGWQIIENKYRKEKYTEDLEIYIVEIPKFRKQTNIDIEDKLTQWMLFIDYKNKGVIKMVKNRNKEIEKAIKELNKLNSDGELRRLVELKQKAELDERSYRKYMADKAREEGLKEGIEQGLRDAKIEIVKAMLKKGMDKKEISQITKLTIEEINKIL